MTPTRVEFLEAAEAELQAATVWYAKRDRAVARAFMTEVQRVTRLLVKQPRVGALWDNRELNRPVRRIPLRRFPYLVVYLEDEVIYIVAVPHTKRQVAYWEKRLAEL